MTTNTNEQDDRVREATPSPINSKIEKDTWTNLSQYMNKSNAEITERIHKVDKEWDIERYLGVNMSTLAMIGLALAYFVHINWLILPAIVLVFFFQHSVQGWCPPLPVLRLFKIRTSGFRFESNAVTRIKHLLRFCLKCLYFIKSFNTL